MSMDNFCLINHDVFLLKPLTMHTKCFFPPFLSPSILTYYREEFSKQSSLTHASSSTRTWNLTCSVVIKLPPPLPLSYLDLQVKKKISECVTCRVIPLYINLNSTPQVELCGLNVVISVSSRCHQHLRIQFRFISCISIWRTHTFFAIFSSWRASISFTEFSLTVKSSAVIWRAAFSLFSLYKMNNSEIKRVIAICMFIVKFYTHFHLYSSIILLKNNIWKCFSMQVLYSGLLAINTLYNVSTSTASFNCSFSLFSGASWPM